MIKRILLTKFLFNFLLIATATEINFNRGWQIKNANGSISLQNQSIPSGIYSALEGANLTGSILHSYNDVNLRWIGKDNWTYTLVFDAPANVNNLTAILVFHGIDSNAQIYLNDLELGKSDNMFVRYRYNVKNRLKLAKNGIYSTSGGILRFQVIQDSKYESVTKFRDDGDNNLIVCQQFPTLPTNNTLRVELLSPISVAQTLSNQNKETPPNCPPTRYNGECHVNFLRKMQASFSWDWGLAAPSMGLWKDVKLEVYQSAIIRDLTYHLEENDDVWTVHLIIHFEAGAEKESDAVEGNVTIELKELQIIPVNQTISAIPDENGEFTVNASFQLTKEKVKLWWPNGYGEQILYTLIVTWESAVGRTDTNNVISVDRKFMMSSKTIRIGFRTVELIEEPLEGGLSFYFKINRLPIFMKGTNWIPSHILPELSADKDRLDFYFGAMKNTHMNMIRVWGGGLYESDYFYDLADEHGILIWQDTMFACAMYPVFDEFLRSVKEEIKQNIRRLQHHPSIAVWAGNNENEAALREDWYATKKEYDRFVEEYIKLYNDTIAEEVKMNDKSHIWLYSSPSNGKNRSSSSIIQDNPQDWHFGDIHYYNYIADGWNHITYPRPRFVSEYGFQSIPSLNSWRSVQDSADNLNELIDHRQHFPLGSVPVIDLIHKNLPMLKENDTMYLEVLIYFSQISQAMTIKAETEVYRIEQDGLMNTMGALYWQLNDVWVAPSWSSIDYNRNFKILHHFAKKFFAPTALAVFIDAANRINVHILRDIKSTKEYFQLTMRIYNWSSLDVKYEHTWNYTSMINRSVENVARFRLDAHLKPPLTKYNAVTEFVLFNGSDSSIIGSNFIFPTKIKDAVGVRDPKIKVQNVVQVICRDGYRKLLFDIVVEAPTLFVYIQIQHDSVDQYELTDNGFMQFQRNQTIGLGFSDPSCSIILDERNIHILTVNKFMN